jgi:hypothetical protein
MASLKTLSKKSKINSLTNLLIDKEKGRSSKKKSSKTKAILKKKKLEVCFDFIFPGLVAK